MVVGYLGVPSAASFFCSRYRSILIVCGTVPMDIQFYICICIRACAIIAELVMLAQVNFLGRGATVKNVAFTVPLQHRVRPE